MNGAASGTRGSPPPCGGELERGVNPTLGIRGIPPSLTLPRKGRGNSHACAEVFAINSLGVRA
jgi:hypothetical protein